MKALVLSFLCFTATATFAAQEGQITMGAPQATTATADASNLTEGGYTFSSLNEGTSYGTVAVLHEFANGFALGARGYLPLQFGKQQQAYMGQVVARFILLNEVNQMFIDGLVTQGYYNGAPGGGVAFNMFGAEYGYMRKITHEISVGGTLGIDYSGDRITQDFLNRGESTLYSKLSLIGAFYF